MVACCGLPFMIIAASGLASLSVISGRYSLLFTSAAIVVVLLVVIGVLARTRSRNRTRARQPKANLEACRR